MYVAVVLLSIITVVWGNIVWTLGGMRASRKIHAKLLKSLLSSTFRYVSRPTSATDVVLIVSSAGSM